MLVPEGRVSPVTNVQDAAITLDEEIRCLLDAGWRWDGDKLVHPKDSEIWRMYTKTNAPNIGRRASQLDAEIAEAVRAVRQQGEQAGSGGQ